MNFLVGVHMLQHSIPVTLNPKSHPQKHIVKISLQPCAKAAKPKEVQSRQKETGAATGRSICLQTGSFLLGKWHPLTARKRHKNEFSKARSR